MTETRTEIEIADRYRNLAERFTRVIDDVPPDRWDGPSPCEGWTVRDIVGHVVAAEQEYVERVGLAGDGLTLPDEPLEAWPAVRDLVQSLLDDPERAATPYESYFGPSTFAATLDQFYSFDLLVHAWDIARATGLAQHEPMPAAEVERCLRESAQWGDAMRQPGGFGPEVPVPADADPQARLLGFLGRHP